MFPAPAAAGAWLAPADGQEIVTNTLGERSETLVYESSTYWEMPFESGETSVVLTPWFETNSDTWDGWRGEGTIGVKHVVYRDERNIVGFQASALWVSHSDGCSEGGAEVRFLGGRTVGETGFVNVEAAARALSGGCEGGRLDVTAGYRPYKNWLALGQVFLDAPLDGDDTVRVQVSLVRFEEDGEGVQLGIRARIDGELAEPAVVLAFWGRPGD